MAQSRRLRTNSVAHRCQRMVIRHKRPKARDFIDRRYRHRSVVEESERAKNRAKSKVRSKVENSIAWHNAPPLAEMRHDLPGKQRHRLLHKRGGRPCAPPGCRAHNALRRRTVRHG